MNNFFYDSSDYSVFKKAYRATRNEPVVINILSSDVSLKGDERPEKKEKVARKNMSNRFEPNSPFGKFFGPRKPNNNPVDMKDFSSWKNKNYRKIEENLNDRENDSQPKFSLSDYLKNRNKNKFYDDDQIKMETQKPITQITPSEPTYKKYFLDRYMNNLEEQSKAKSKFDQNDDLLEPLGQMSQNVVPDSSQDEDFEYRTKVDIEDIAFDEEDTGNQFKIELEELDRIKEKLDKIEKRNESQESEEKEEEVFSILQEEEAEPEIEEVYEEEADEAETEEVIDETSEENETEQDDVDDLNNSLSEEDEKDKAEMQEKLVKLMDENNKADEIHDYKEKLKNAELEKQKVAEEYELKIKELEESYNKHVEELKKQSYQEKLDSEDAIDDNTSLNSELKSNLNISDFEMYKKLHEISSESNVYDVNRKNLSEIDINNDSNSASSKPKIDVEIAADVKPKKRRKRTKKRRVDSDIVGSINFD